MIGIVSIQKAATGMSNMLRVTKSYERTMNPVWDIEENIEILTRTYLRRELHSILSGQLAGGLVQELSDVLFNIVYPAYT